MHIIQAEQMTKKEIIQKIRALYLQRKEMQGDTLTTLAAEIGISYTRLNDSINGKFTSGKTVAAFLAYLEKMGLLTEGAQN